MASTAVPQAAARLRRIDLRVVIGLALLLVGVAGTLGIVQQAGARTPVLVMARDVPAGRVIGEQDVRVAELGLAPGVASLGVGERPGWWAGWPRRRCQPGRCSAPRRWRPARRLRRGRR
jgi:hypothetical protein